MSDHHNENPENCTHDCSNCSENCEHATESLQQALRPGARVDKVIAVVSGCFLEPFFFVGICRVDRPLFTRCLFVFHIYIVEDVLSRSVVQKPEHSEEIGLGLRQRDAVASGRVLWQRRQF